MIAKSMNIKKHKVNRIIGKVVAYSILVLFALIFTVPFLFAFVTSFTPPNGIYDFKWIPTTIDVGNYVKLVSENNIIKGFINTVLYIVPPVFVGMFFSALAAYAFAKLRFPGKNIVFFALLATMVVPGVLTMIPSYVLFTNFYKWTGTPLPLIIPGMFGGAMTMFFIRQYFATIPTELEDAAKIDGMNYFAIFLKIILPLSTPVLVTQIILSLNGAYNDYLGPLLYVGTDRNLHTIQLVVAGLQSSRSLPYTLMMAGAMTALLPTFVLFIFAQKYFVEGIVMSGLKG